MFTVKEVSDKTGVSIRTLRYYDQIGLLRPSDKSAAGYRLYDDSALEDLQQILIYRMLKFPLKDIRAIMQSPHFDRQKALEQQIELLTLQRDHLNDLIDFARGIHGMGMKNLSFDVFDTKKIDEYSRQAREQWGKTEAYGEYNRKMNKLSKEEQNAVFTDFIEYFKKIGALKDLPANDPEVRGLVEALRSFINEHFYTCTPQIFASLARMYAGGGEMTDNINAVGGEGAAQFASEAILEYLKTE